jgi:hypothetical protein
MKEATEQAMKDLKVYPVLEYQPGDQILVDGWYGNILHVARKLSDGDYEVRLMTKHRKVIGRVAIHPKYMKPWVSKKNRAASGAGGEKP